MARARMQDDGVATSGFHPTHRSTLAPARTSAFGNVVSESPEMRALFDRVRRVAGSDVPVVIEGETGTGKEVLAEAIHEQSLRANGPFVVFDCTAVPPNLLESALFGHERGAFTGAVSARQGVFEQANGGTLLIDEIGDLDLALQSKLLRAIERSEVRRVGGDAWQKVNVRVIAATRRDLPQEIREGRFRDDLFYRIAVVRLHVPALRARTGDVAVLTEHFWRSLGGKPEDLTPELVRRFEEYEWPGNVRQLRNAVARSIALGDMAEQEPFGHVPSEAPRAPAPSSPPPSGEQPAQAESPEDVLDSVINRRLPYPQARDAILHEFNRRYCEAALKAHGGNVTRASEASGIARRYFYVIRAQPSDGARNGRAPGRAR